MKKLWLSIHNNPFFVTGWTLFAGSLAEQLTVASKSGHMDVTLGGIQDMLFIALTTTVIALLHLHLPKPEATK